MVAEEVEGVEVEEEEWEGVVVAWDASLLVHPHYRRQVSETEDSTHLRKSAADRFASEDGKTSA